MSGLRIFQHSVRMLFNNLPDAFKVSLPLVIVMAAAALFGSTAMIGADMDADSMMAYSSTDLLLSLLWGIASLWTVVAWHRFVLLEEYPNGFPAFRGSEILVYFFKSLLIGLGIGIPLGLGLGLVAVIVPALAVVLLLVAIPFAVMVFYRLSPLLASAALGKPMSFGEAWGKTDGMSGAVLVAALLTFVAGIVLQLLGGLIYALVPFVGVVGLFAANWAVTLIAASMVTTIYGVAVENRNV